MLKRIGHLDRGCDFSRLGSDNLASARDIAVAEAGRVLGRPSSQITMSDGTIAALRTTDQRIARFKGFSRDLKSTIAVDVDLASGMVVDGDALTAKTKMQSGTHAANFGDNLRNRLASSWSDPVKIVMWLDAPADDHAPPIKPPASRGGPKADATSIVNAAVARRSAEIAPVRSRVLQQLQKVDSKARAQDSSPLAYAEVPASYTATLQAKYICRLDGHQLRCSNRDRDSELDDGCRRDYAGLAGSG